MKDINIIKHNIWTTISYLYVVEPKRKILFSTIFLNKKKPVHVALGPIIFTEFSEVYSRLLNYNKICSTVDSKDFTNFIYPKQKLTSFPIIDLKIINNCYKFMCLLYNNVFITFNLVPKSSFISLFYKIKNSTVISIDTTYKNNLNCCTKISYDRIYIKLNMELSKLVKHNICPSFPVLYYNGKIVFNKKKLIILILEQIGPTFSTFYMLDIMFANDKIFMYMENIDKILFEYIYSLYCLNVNFNIYHGDLHLNNITIFTSRNTNTTRAAYVLQDITFIFNNACNRTAGILDVMRLKPNLLYFTGVFKILLNDINNNEIVKLCSITDSYVLLNNIRLFLFINKFNKTMLYSRINEILNVILNMVDSKEKIIKLLSTDKWPNQLLLKTVFKKYISDNIGDAIVYSACGAG